MNQGVGMPALNCAIVRLEYTLPLIIIIIIIIIIIKVYILPVVLLVAELPQYTVQGMWALWCLRKWCGREYLNQF
jgi:Cu/Ag efflux pump CusA